MVRRLASRCPSVLVEETTEAIDADDLAVVRFAPHLRAPNWSPLAEVWDSESTSGSNGRPGIFVQ
jgi:hypothetical protein